MRAEYGIQIVQSVIGELYQRYGRRNSELSLYHIVRFYKAYPILSAVQREFQKLDGEKMSNFSLGDIL